MSGCLCLNCTDLLKPAALNVLWTGNAHLWHCLIEATRSFNPHLSHFRLVDKDGTRSRSCVSVASRDLDIVVSLQHIVR